eukprot:TRINITY_DN1688_c0_g1_i1.p1 TRINITY_DN1688_c0_g1~~TRINITY_DN1688_c0_g1_i1.p1  ORF type:complete len:765 (-),score=132.35 TRINITY_DN1688_c0_g1_i1:6131-8425(-)
MPLISLMYALMVKQKQQREIELLTSRSKDYALDNRAVEEKMQRHKKVEQELRAENLRLQKRVSELEASADIKYNQYKAELNKLAEEKERALREADEWHSNFEEMNREIEDQRENEKTLRKELARVTFANDELQEKVAYYQRRYKSAIAEHEGEMRRKRHEEVTAREDLTLQKLSDIEQKLANLHIVLSPKEEHRETEERVDTEKLLEGDSESFEHKLENYQKHKGRDDNLLQKLTSKILQKEELQNSHIRELFKLEEIDLEDKANEYKNLLKAMGALYYANRHAKLVAGVFSYWRAMTEEILRQREAAEEEQIEEKTVSEQATPEEKEQQTVKPAIEINTELANREVGQTDELMNELQINTNKEPSNLGADKDLLRYKKKEGTVEESKEQPIHVDENYDAKPNEYTVEAEPEEYDDEEFEEEEESKEPIPESEKEPAPESEKEEKKVRLEDIDENDLKDLVTQLREHLIAELQEEMEDRKELKEAPEAKSEESEAIEHKPKENEETTSSIYYNVISGITEYFFTVFNKSVKYSKVKKTYVSQQLLKIENRCQYLQTYVGSYVPWQDSRYSCQSPQQVNQNLCGTFRTLRSLQMRVWLICKHKIARRKITGSPQTDKNEVVAAELYNWCGEVLERIGKCRVRTEEEVYKYLYQLLAVMYRCAKDGKPVLLHENHRKVIEENLVKTLEVYFKEYERYQDELLKVEQKEDISSGNISRHMFCKYPFLKPLLNKQSTAILLRIMCGVYQSQSFKIIQGFLQGSYHSQN